MGPCDARALLSVTHLKLSLLLRGQKKQRDRLGRQRGRAPCRALQWEARRRAASSKLLFSSAAAHRGMESGVSSAIGLATELHVATVRPARTSKQSAKYKANAPKYAPSCAVLPIWRTWKGSPAPTSSGTASKA